MTDKRIALTTTASKDEAQKIARVLVEQRLAACVNVVGPVDSTYSWLGRVEQSSEYLLTESISSRARRISSVRLIPLAPRA